MSRINQVKPKSDDYDSYLTRVKAKMRALVEDALTELQKIREKQNSSLPENAAPEEAPSRDKCQDSGPKNLLDIEIEKLLFIKKFLEEPTPAIPEYNAPAVGADEVAAPKKNILIVDDDPTTVKIVAHFLEREGYIVTSSHSGEEGLERAAREKPCLILLDIMIPDLNGFQFLSLLRKNKDMASVPVILLSMLAQEADILKGLEIGAVDYVTKPFSPAILLAKIKKYTGREK